MRVFRRSYTAVTLFFTDPKWVHHGGGFCLLANNAFLGKNPAATRLFEVMSNPLAYTARQNNRMFAGENSADGIERHVSQWVALHEEIWNGGLEEARKTAQHD